MNDYDELAIYEEGQEAFWEGLDESDCPYDIGSDEAMCWNDGYNDPRE